MVRLNLYISLVLVKKYQVFNEIHLLSIFMAHGSNTAALSTKEKLDV